MSTSFSALPRRTRQQHGSNRQRRRYSSRDTVAVVNLSATTQKVHGTFICIRQQHINLHTSAAARGGTREEDTEVHLEVTRPERHAIFRRSISLDDVDCFDTWNRRLNSGTNASHCSNKGFKILLEFFCCALRAKVVFFVRRHRRK